MKNTIIIAFLLISTVAFSQTKKELITKKWSLNKVIDFGQEYDPMDSQKGDWIEFTADGKFTGIMEGLHVEGTFTAGKTVVLKVDKTKSKLQINWTKVKSVTKDKFLLEYQNGDLITSTLIFIPAQ
ncbi:MAG: hypothetical protein P1U41_07320 [Vicingaceae bacterium]|nr:hypothetical protein [Vicingaceae bacterium]